MALIGPLADTRNNIAGTWSVAQTPEKYTTLKEAMQQALKGKAELLYAQGSNIWRDAQLQKNGEFDKPMQRGDNELLKARGHKGSQRCRYHRMCHGRKCRHERRMRLTHQSGDA